MPVKAKSWGYVYILQCQNRYKIGYSGNLKTLARRITRLRNLNAFEIEIALIICHRRAHLIETNLHCDYDNFRRNGEWFELPDEAIKTIQEKYQRYIYEGKEQ